MSDAKPSEKMKEVKKESSSAAENVKNRFASTNKMTFIWVETLIWMIHSHFCFFSVLLSFIANAYCFQFVFSIFRYFLFFFDFDGWRNDEKENLFSYLLRFDFCCFMYLWLEGSLFWPHTSYFLQLKNLLTTTTYCIIILTFKWEYVMIISIEALMCLFRLNEKMASENFSIRCKNISSC